MGITFQQLGKQVWQRFAALRRWLTLDGCLSMPHPSLLLLALTTLLLAVIAPYRWLIFLLYAELLLLIASYGWLRVVAPRLIIQRKLEREWAQVGDLLSESWQLTNHAWLPLLWLELDDATTLPGYTARRVVAVSANASMQWQTQAMSVRRGIYTLGPLRLATSDPLGIFSYTRRDETTRSIVIYPPLLRLPSFIAPKGQRGGLARTEQLEQLLTPSVGGLREYLPGDPPSYVHWPTVARTGKLMVKQFDQERAGAIWIVLDLAARSYNSFTTSSTSESSLTHTDEAAIYRAEAVTQRASALPDLNDPAVAPTALDLAITLACSLASQALSEGRTVGLLANDGRMRRLTPGRGPRQLWRILGELVDVQATGELALDELLRLERPTHSTQESGSALMVITPDSSGSWLPAVLSWVGGHTNEAFAALVTEHAAHSKPLAGQLATLGIATHSFVVGERLPLLEEGKSRSVRRVSPFGKVVQSETPPRS